MSIDQLSSRCRACGAILRARQSCERCATAARARLHAAGVARYDATTPMLEPPGAPQWYWGVDPARSDTTAVAVARRESGGTLVIDEVASYNARHQRELERAVDFLTGLDATTRNKAMPTPDRPTRAGTTLLSQVSAAAAEAHRRTGVVPWAVATPQKPERDQFVWEDARRDAFDGSWRSYACLWRGCQPPAEGGNGGWVFLHAADEPGWRWRVSPNGAVVFDVEAPSSAEDAAWERHQARKTWRGARTRPPPLGAEVPWEVPKVIPRCGR